ncbi:MAG: HAMP domain-containing histidine kinase [Bacilli bacterium]|nr:HAMP domain-containing histidine kinase [Bacilli bacterium]
MKKTNLIREIWKYFLLFSLFILLFLWTTQVTFFDRYYRNSKIKDTKDVANTIKKYKDSKLLIDIMNQKSMEKEVCIEIVDDGGLPVYTASFHGKGCLPRSINNIEFKASFISSKKEEETFEIVNPNYNNDTIVEAIKLEDNTYAFVNTSIEPIEAITYLNRNLLIVATIIILLLSLVTSYYISRHISTPIIRLNKQAKRLAKQDFQVEFSSNTKIEEIKELESTLNYAKQELEKTDELRRDLMANVSHDLKTPLTMIKAYAEACCDIHKGKPEKQQEDMDTIIKETERLTTLINDILTLSKMQNQMEELELEEFDLIDLINQILKNYKYLQESENYQFEFIHSKSEYIIKADKKKLEQVLYNLINNAINYTGEDNKVIIKIQKNKVEITDTGKGIKGEDLPYIWDKYYKNKKKHKRNLVGTGLGLSIVKQILEAHDYKYGVDTKRNVGTTFYFEIKEEY